MMRQDHRGFSLIEIIVTLALASIVTGLVGSIFVGSLSAWRRGRDLREAQIQAIGLADLMIRDVRNANRATGVAIRPRVALGEGEPILLISNGAPAIPDESPAWILYLFFSTRGEVLRYVLTAPSGGRIGTRDSRVVGRGITKVSAVPVDYGVTIEVEVRRGTAIAQTHATGTPRNP